MLIIRDSIKHDLAMAFPPDFVWHISPVCIMSWRVRLQHEIKGSSDHQTVAFPCQPPPPPPPHSPPYNAPAEYRSVNTDQLKVKTPNCFAHQLSYYCQILIHYTGAWAECCEDASLSMDSAGILPPIGYKPPVMSSAYWTGTGEY